MQYLSWQSIRSVGIGPYQGSPFRSLFCPGNSSCLRISSSSLESLPTQLEVVPGSVKHSEQPLPGLLGIQFPVCLPLLIPGKAIRDRICLFLFPFSIRFLLSHLESAGQEGVLKKKHQLASKIVPDGFLFRKQSQVTFESSGKRGVKSSQGGKRKPLELCQGKPV